VKPSQGGIPTPTTPTPVTPQVQKGGIPTPPKTPPPQTPQTPPKTSESLAQELAKKVPQTPPTRETPGDTPEEKWAQINLELQEELKSLGNYRGEISREEAEALLANAPGPVWLTRYSSNIKQVVVSCKNSKGEVKHTVTIDAKDKKSMTRDEVVETYKGFKMLSATAKPKDQPKAKTGKEPEPEGDEKTWKESHAKAHDNIKKAIETAVKSKNLVDKERIKEITHQFQEAEKAAANKEFGRAFSLLGLTEKLVNELNKDSTTTTPPPDLAGQYKEAKTKTEAMFNRLEKFAEVPPKRLAPAKQLYQRALQHGTRFEHAQALDLLKQAQALEPSLLSAGLWEKQIDMKNYGKGKALKHGAFGEVYLLDNKTNDPKAPSLVYKLPLTDESKKELKHEQDIYSQIGDHPNIARCLGMRTVDGQDGLVMEAISGGDMSKGLGKLRDQLKKGEIKQEQFWGVMQFSLLKSLEALDYMSTQGLAHIDIKPDNIMFDDKTGEPKLVDMGLAAQRGSGGGGTPGFMSPEAGMGQGGQRSDVFSVGSTAYEVGEGERFAYNRPQQLNDAFSSGAPEGAFFDLLQEFGESGEEAVHKSDVSSQEVDPKTGAREKIAGRHGASTAYTKFVNWLMNPDPTKRPTAKEALNHPFLKDRILPDDECRTMIKELHK
jgi:hypothetical protein